MSKIVLTDAATPTGISSGTTALYTKSGGGPGTDGLYYKQGADPEVGPLVVGSTVNNLQDAYDGGNAILVSGSNPVSISSTAVGGPDALTVTVGGSTNASGVVVTHSGPGASPAIEAEIVNPASTGDVISSTSNGAGSALYAETTGLGNGITVYTASGSVGKGIVSFMGGTGAAVYAEKGNTGNGIEVKMISSATGSGLKVESATTLAAYPGIAVDHAGEAVGVSTTMTSVGNATGFSAYLDAAGPFAAGMRIELSDPAAAGVGLQITMPNTATGNAIEVQDPVGPPSPTTVFSVDPSGRTTTPSITFNGGSTITIYGDPGAGGQPINPRVELTSGSTNVGAVARTHFISVSINGVEDLEANAAATSQQPTMLYLYSVGLGTLNMISSSRYPEGTEVLLLNRGGAGAGPVSVAPLGALGQNLIKVEASGDVALAIPVGTGARFLSRGTLGWTKTGTF